MSNSSKKGQKTKCNNWRDIAFQLVGSKVLCQIILNRIQSKVEKVLRDEQRGLRHSIYRLSQSLQLNTPRDHVENFNALRDPDKTVNITKAL